MVVSIKALLDCSDMTIKDDLVVAEAYANQAPSFKRVSFRGRGGVDTIIKRNCHITIVLDSVKK